MMENLNRLCCFSLKQIWKFPSSQRIFLRKQTEIHFFCAFSNRNPRYFLNTKLNTSHKCLLQRNVRFSLYNISKNLRLFCDKVREEKQNFIKQKELLIQDVIKQKKDQLKLSGKTLLKDIQETKEKVKEKMEEVIEKENVLTIPNILCVSRIIMSPFIGLFIIQSQYHLALGILIFAGFTDLLDGWIARLYKSQASKLGSFLDPMADKVLIATLFLSLTYMDLIPVWLTALIITRDLSLVSAGFYIRYLSLPPPRNLSRYFDITHATVQLAPTTISKANTAVQLLMVASTLAAPVFHYVDHPILQTLWYITATTTIASAVSYMISRNTYILLKKKKR